MLVKKFADTSQKIEYGFVVNQQDMFGGNGCLSPAANIKSLGKNMKLQNYLGNVAKNRRIHHEFLLPFANW